MFFIAKVTAVILFAELMQVSANVYSQKTKLNLALENVSVETLLKTIEKQSGYHFLYRSDLLKKVPNVSLNVEEIRMEEVLDRVIVPQGFVYEIDDQVVIIKKAAERESSGQSTEQQEIKLSGKVTNTDGESLVGVTVLVKGTSTGTITDINGNFALTTDRQNPILVVSYIGYETREIKIVDDKELKIVLTLSDTGLEEVVITGMFDRRAESFTGSAVTLTAKDLRSVGNSNVIQSLKNLDPSFRITENLLVGSNPNALMEIQLRGQSGFPDLKGEYATNPNQPLFIVDGFEASLTKVIDMDMNRISTVTLLKDAAAKAIYGSKAANGVVVIETKRPESGRLRTTYTGTLNVNLPDLSSYDLCNAAEKLQVEQNAGIYNYVGYNGVVYWTNPASQYGYTEQYNTFLKEVLAGVDTDWKAQPLRNAAGQKHALYIEGGDDAFQYGIDFAYNNVAGVMKGSDRNTISGGLNFSYRYKNLLLRDNLEVVYNKGDNSPWGAFNEYTSMNPYLRPYDESGNLIKSYAISTLSSPVVNPMWNASIKTKDFSKYTQITNNFYAEYRAFDGFRITARLGMTKTDDGSEVFHPASHTDFTTYTTDELMKRRGIFTYGDGYDFRIATDINASYSKNIQKHLLIANLGYSLNSETKESMSITAEGFPNDQLDNIGYARAYLKDGRPSSSESAIRDLGVIGALNYAFDDRYLLDASMRFSGSSQFGSDNRWGNFWSLGVGWNLHHESFLKSLTWLNRLKLRTSIGFTGSQNFNSYQSQSTWHYYSSTFYDGNVGAYLLGLANDRLKWQRKKDFDSGIDLTAFNNRLNVKFDYYNSITDDLLTDVTVPSSTGFNSYKENLGKVQNRGYEIYVNGRVYENTRQHNYLNIYVSASHNSNRIKEISNSLASYNEEQLTSLTNKPVTRYEEGQSMNAIWAVPSRGIDPATGRDVFVKRDGTTTFVWDADDLDICGNTEASLYGIGGMNLAWQGFTVNVSMSYKFGGQIYNQTLVDKVENADLTLNVDRRIFSDRWVNPGDVSRFKNITDKTTTYATSRFVEDNDVWTLSSVNLSYDFDRFTAVRKWGFSRLRLSFDMAEPLRASSVKIERGTAYPFARTFSFSLQAMF